MRKNTSNKTPVGNISPASVRVATVPANTLALAAERLTCPTNRAVASNQKFRRLDPFDPVDPASTLQAVELARSLSVFPTPVSVKPPLFVFHVLLLSGGTSYSAEVIAGWEHSEACFEDPHPCNVVHCNFNDDHDLLTILKLFDKVREGFFRVVLDLPPAATWSRARHAGPVVNRPFAPDQNLGVFRKHPTFCMRNCSTTTEQSKYRRGLQSNLFCVPIPKLPSSTFFRRTSEGNHCQAQLRCGPCKN